MQQIFEIYAFRLGLESGFKLRITEGEMANTILIEALDPGARLEVFKFDDKGRLEIGVLLPEQKQHPVLERRDER